MHNVNINTNIFTKVSCAQFVIWQKYCRESEGEICYLEILTTFMKKKMVHHLGWKVTKTIFLLFG